jgi:hypothetical protein
MAIVKLSDGKKISIQGRILQEEGSVPEFNLWFTTDSYNRLVSFIESKIKENV